MNALRAVALSWLLISTLPLLAQKPVRSDSIISYVRTADGVDLQTHRGTLQVRLCTESMVHMVFREVKFRATSTALDLPHELATDRVHCNRRHSSQHRHR